MARTRRPRGSGCYDKCGDFYRWRIGIYDPETGKTHYISIKAKSREALTQKVTEWQEKNGNGEDAPLFKKGHVTVRQWAEEWIESARNKREARTVFNYEMTVNKYLLPRFGKMWIGKVSPRDLQAFFDKLSKTLAPGTVAKIRAHISTCFERAVKFGLIPRNPVRLTEPPKSKKTEIRIIEDEEAARLLEVAKNGSYRGRMPTDESEEYVMKRNYIIVLLAIASGMRKGEILGLTWPCVDTDNAQITVKYSLQDFYKARVLKCPKNGKTRVVTIPVNVARELAEWREYQAAFAKKYNGFYTNPQSLVINSAEGHCIDGSIFSARVFRVMANTAGILGLRFHDLRHYFASSALTNGVPVQVVSAQLGHSSVSVTYNIYTHILKQSRDKLKEMLDNNPLFL